MGMERLVFGIMYRIGFTPWDGHPQAAPLRELVEGGSALPAGRALDLGCGSGDTAIYLAKHGWDVTAVDFVERALERARAKAEAASAKVRFMRADVTRLGSYGIGSGFQLIVDNGCLHGLSPADRDAYVREVSAVAAPAARFLLLGFAEGKRPGPKGFNRPEVEQRFAREWQLTAANVADGISSRPKDPIHVYQLVRRA